MSDFKSTPYVFADDDAEYIVIVGVTSAGEAEKALSESEYAEISFSKFQPKTIYHGIKDGEGEYYWGDKPEEHFEGHVSEEQGYIATND